MAKLPYWEGKGKGENDAMNKKKRTYKGEKEGNPKEGLLLRTVCRGKMGEKEKKGAWGGGRGR